MQYKIRLIIVFALIIALAYIYFQKERFENLSNTLFEENKTLKEKYQKIKDNDLRKKIKILEQENKFLKEQIFLLEKEQFYFKTNPDNTNKYKLQENLPFKDDTQEFKDKIPKSKEIKEEYKITPSLDIDKDKGDIGVKLKIETTF